MIGNYYGCQLYAVSRRPLRDFFTASRAALLSSTARLACLSGASPEASKAPSQRARRGTKVPAIGRNLLPTHALGNRRNG
jgi:hypothetical protein